MIFENAIYHLNQITPRLLNLLSRSRRARKFVSQLAFQSAGRNTHQRPHPYSMASGYTTWQSLTDRRFTGRHLREYPAQSLPTLAAVTDLFMREKETVSIRSTLLFAAFAQWFTDSFLRTDHGMLFDDAGNPLFDGTSFRRKPDRHRLNTSNHEVDLCQIYGLTEEQTSMLRTKSAEGPGKGCLKSQTLRTGEYPAYILESASDALTPLHIKEEFKALHDERLIRAIFGSVAREPDRHKAMFAVGLEHGNSTLGNSLMNTIFLREHNRVARLIAKRETGWDDERVFQTTRNTMIAVLLKIVVSDYIRHISPYDFPIELVPGFADRQRWYRANRIAIEFNLLYRWHQLIPDNPTLLGGLAAYRDNNPLLVALGVGEMVRRLSLEPAGRIGLQNTAKVLKFVEQDTLSLMRASQLAPYNAYRTRFGMKPVETFEELTGDPALAARLRQVYGNDVNQLEWYVGIFAERHPKNYVMGELLTRMVAWDAFTQALTNPLLADGVFEEPTFSATGWNVINETVSLEDVLRHQEPDGFFVCSFNQERAKEQEKKRGGPAPTPPPPQAGPPPAAKTAPESAGPA